MVVRQRLDEWQASRGRNPLNPGQAHVPAENRPRFFFDPDTANFLAAEIRKRLPDDAASVVESARRIQQGRFDLLGYSDLSFGGNIDWSLDPVHGIRAPHLPWFRVPYLDFSKTGDHKIVWELSRHQHLMLLARAWLYSGDEQFLDVLETRWRDWRLANPYPYGINWASTLEVAFRCLSWIWVDHLTAGPHNDLRTAIGESAVYIERYISTYFAPNTHLLGEALALFFVGVLYPEFERARYWREYGWKVLLQESERQVRPDGFHFEQSVYYHVYALDMFLHARILAARNDIPIPPSFDAALVRMADGLAVIGAGGQAPRFGDDDGGRLFDGRRNRREHMLDPLATASIVYGRGDWKAQAGGLREETAWLLGLDGIRVLERLAGDATQPPRSRAFTASGYYTLRSGEAVAIVDAGPHGWGRGGHGHADALSLQLIAGGQAWLTDPGTCSYPREKVERDRFRGTAAHNTLEVDGVSQAEPIHSFAWKSVPNVMVHRWQEGGEVTVFHASHDGYSRLGNPVTHERWVIAWNDGVWFVRDVALGQGSHRLDLRWHLAPEPAAGPGPLDIVIADDTRWTAHQETGAWSAAYGATAPAPVLRFSYQGLLPAECATVLAFKQQEPVVVHTDTGDGAIVYVYGLGRIWRALIFATRPGRWQFGGIESEERLLTIDCSDVTAAKSLRQALERLWDRGPAGVQSESSETGSIL